MNPQRRTALVSVGAAAALIALKLGAGLASHSLGLISEALHSGTDLVAALLTFFAVGVAVRPADVSHQYGHGKAEHLSALAEAAILAAASCFIAWRAISHLVGGRTATVEATWYAFFAIGIVDDPQCIEHGIAVERGGHPSILVEADLQVRLYAAIGSKRRRPSSVSRIQSA